MKKYPDLHVDLQGLVRAAAGAIMISVAVAAADPVQQRSFTSPSEAARALASAAQSADKAALKEILGTDCNQFLTGDEGRDVADFKSFADIARKECVCTPSSGERADRKGVVMLEIGPDRWPFPIPLAQESGRWFFDSEAGKEELLNRHIGSDELHAIGICRAYVKETAPQLTTLLNQARTEGLAAQTAEAGRHCHGYIFKTLEPRHGATGHAAMVAYPAEYRRSGVMTFLVDSNGKVYQRDLGDKTTSVASALTQYKPGRRWKEVDEAGVQDWNVGESR